MPQIEVEKSRWRDNKWFRPVMAVVIPVVVIGSATGIYMGWRYLAERENREYAQVSEQASKQNELKQYAAAAKLMQKYLEGKHTGEHTYQITVGLAYDYALLGDEQKGFETMKRAEEIMPKGTTSVFLHSSLGGAYTKRGDKTNAIREYRQAIADAEKDKNYTTTPYKYEFQKRIAELEQRP